MLCKIFSGDAIALLLFSQKCLKTVNKFVEAIYDCLLFAVCLRFGFCAVINYWDEKNENNNRGNIERLPSCGARTLEVRRLQNHSFYVQLTCLDGKLVLT